MDGGRALVVAMLAACSTGVPPAPVAPTASEDRASSPQVERPACIEQPDEPAAIRFAGGDDARVTYCVGTKVGQCFALELATGALAQLAEEPTAQPPAIETVARVETTNPDFKVCTEAAGCKTLTPKVWPGAAPLRAATDGDVAAVMLGDAERGRGYVEVFDVLKGKRLAKFRYARGVFKCGEIAMLGSTIYVNATTCSGPSGRAALYTTRGRKIANVGGRGDFGTYGNSYTQVEGPVWAFLSENGNRIAIQDVVKGKVKKSIDVSALFSEVSGATMGNPGESAIVRLGPGKLAVIGGTPANGSVAIVEVESGTVQVVRAPLCN